VVSWRGRSLHAVSFNRLQELTIRALRLFLGLVKTYRGNCHCGVFVYEMESAEIRSVRECNCSICHKKGYLWVRPKSGSFRIVKGDEESLATYTFGSGNVLHKFCSTCATPLMAHLPGGQRALNVSAPNRTEFRPYHCFWLMVSLSD